MTHAHCRLIPNLLMTGALALLAACANPPVKEKLNYVQESEASHAVTFEGTSQKLSADELHSLDLFLDSVPLEAASRVTLISSDNSKANGKRVAMLRRQILEGGVRPSVVAEAYAPGGVPEIITVQVEYATATMQGCPDWSRNSLHNYENRAFSNWSCATRTNLGKMIVDPHDLVRGEGRMDPDPDRNSAALQTYASPPAGSTASSSSSSASSGGSQ